MSPDRPHRTGGGERGYALVALLVLMTVMMLAMMAAAPRVRQQSRRELEFEAVRRGEEVAEAIRLYLHYRNGELPTSIEQLLAGVPFGTKKLSILRRSAARDPLSASGEWRLIRLGDPALVRFQRDVALYAGGQVPPTGDPGLHVYAQRLAAVGAVLLPQQEEAGEDFTLSGAGGPFIGVASRSSQPSVIHYYGIMRHDRWVFTPLFR